MLLKDNLGHLQVVKKPRTYNSFPSRRIYPYYLFNKSLTEVTQNRNFALPSHGLINNYYKYCYDIKKGSSPSKRPTGAMLLYALFWMILA